VPVNTSSDDMGFVPPGLSALDCWSSGVVRRQWNRLSGTQPRVCIANHVHGTTLQTSTLAVIPV
jgi:hypothetical protein